MNRLLPTLAAGYCCIWRFMQENVLHVRVAVAAEDLGVTEATIRNWKRRFDWNEFLPCPNCEAEQAAPSHGGTEE